MKKFLQHIILYIFSFLVLASTAIAQTPNATIWFKIKNEDSVVYFNKQEFQQTISSSTKNYIVKCYKSERDTMIGNNTYENPYSQSTFKMKDDVFSYLQNIKYLTSWGEASLGLTKDSNAVKEKSGSNLSFNAGFGGNFILLILRFEKEKIDTMIIGFKNIPNEACDLTILFTPGKFILDVPKIIAVKKDNDLTPAEWKE